MNFDIFVVLIFEEKIITYILGDLQTSHMYICFLQLPQLSTDFFKFWLLIAIYFSTSVQQISNSIYRSLHYVYLKNKYHNIEVIQEKLHNNLIILKHVLTLKIKWINRPFIEQNIVCNFCFRQISFAVLRKYVFLLILASIPVAAAFDSTGQFS